MAEPGTPFDVVVLGGGSAGYATALRAAQLGLDVALVESGRLGGTCLHNGCIPTKALLHAAELADGAREGAKFGVRSTLEGIDMAGVNAYKDGVVAGLYKGLQGLVSSRGITYVEGHGRLVAQDTVEVDGTRYTGRHVVLATGSYARSLPGLEIGGRVVTSDQALRLDRVPKSVVVLGGGVIGVEFASVWKSFGADVQIVEALPHLVPNEDVALSKALERAFRKRGIAFSLGDRFAGVKETDSGVTVTLESGKTFEAELLLVAVGRGPRTADLGFEEQGLTLDRGFVIVDERLHTGVGNIWAAGDIVPGLQLAHRGFAQGIFLAEQIAGLDPTPIVELVHPPGHVLRARGRVRRRHRGRRRRDVGGRPGRVPRVQPRRQRQEQDPRDERLRQARAPQGRSRRRRAHDRRPRRRARRRGPADRGLGGVPRGRRRPGPRPPHPERGTRRGAPGPGRQASARPQLTPTIEGDQAGHV